MSARKKLLSLIFLFLLLGGIYWGFGNTPLTLPVTYLYYALCLILSLLYLLVSGGIEPIRPKGRNEERPNPLRLPQKTREKWSMRLLVLAIPFYLIFLLDFLYLRFFV